MEQMTTADLANDRRALLRAAGKMHATLTQRRGLDRIQFRKQVAKVREAAVTAVHGIANLTSKRGTPDEEGNAFYRLRQDVLSQINALNRSRNLDPNESRETVSLRTLVDELRAAAREFGNLTASWTDQWVEVVTEPITLEDVPFGRFALRIRWIDSRFSLRVEALDPNECPVKQQVYHPHVYKDAICLGDAEEAFDLAMWEGRVCDALLLARGVLLEYGDDNPHATLEDWAGESSDPCSSCGIWIDEDEGSVCCQCDVAVLCDDCKRHCDACNEVLCSNCSMPCEDCNGYCCPVCLNRNDVCSSCQEEQDEEAASKEGEDESEDEESEAIEDNGPTGFLPLTGHLPEGDQAIVAITTHNCTTATTSEAP